MTYATFDLGRYFRGQPAAALIVSGMLLWCCEDAVRRMIAERGPRFPLMMALGMYLLAHDEPKGSE